MNHSIYNDGILKLLVDEIPIGVVLAALDGKPIATNKNANKYLSIQNTNDIDNIFDYLMSQVLTEGLDDLRLSMRTPFVIDSCQLNNRFLSISGKLFLDGFIVTIEDISTVKNIEANSIHAILEAQEDERRRIGREIHDGIGPLLSAMKLRLDSFKDEEEISKSETSIGAINSITETIDNVTGDLRLITQRLVPRLLEEFGLYVAFQNLAVKLNEVTKNTITFYCNFDKEIRFSNEIELNLFRCGQELINNSVKYASADSILIQLIEHSDSLVLMVEDDGVGFEKKELLPDKVGIGLTNIQTRVRLLNGDFIIDSSIGRGTVSSIEIPIEK